jgi:hypothetical protein
MVGFTILLNEASKKKNEPAKKTKIEKYCAEIKLKNIAQKSN